jgi:predicted alpha-1,2-mannosidase
MKFLKSLCVLFFTLCLAVLSSCKDSSTLEDQSSLSKWVDPMIGTSGHGHTFPGATLPFGMVQLSPDTYTEGWDWCSGYHYSDGSIIGFSHTHLSGTGRGDLLDILVMPISGEVKWQPGSRENPNQGYRSRFSHKNEQALPGYYSVFLDDYKIRAELTATRRAGFHRYTFEGKEEASILIDLFHSLKSDSVIHASIRMVNDTLVVGSRQTRGWGEKGEAYWVNHEVFFAMRLSKPLSGISIQKDGRLVAGMSEDSGRIIKADLKFKDSHPSQLLVKVGISAVDVEGAIKNVDAEIPRWNFDDIRVNAKKEWEDILSKILVKTNDKERRRTFYTAIYHACIAPFTYSDVDNRYRGFDHKIHSTNGGINYTGFSLWDTFRAANPLFTLLVPERVPDMISSMLAQYDQTGLLPVWPLCSSETNCMIGYHSVPVIVDAYLNGISDFDVEKAYQAMKNSAMQDSFGIKYLKKYGFIPSDLENKSVSKTLEYAFDDWCLAQMAQKLGKKDDYKYFMERSQAFKKVFDSKTNFMRGRNVNGSFAEPFDPTFASYGKSDFIEGNAWQYSWFVPQDIPGLINLMGGNQVFAKKLDDLFSATTSSHDGKPLDISGLIGEYAHGNEPSHHVAYLYNYAGMPWKTQEKLFQIMNTLYTDKPDGLCGNEDMGQMSAWYVFSAMGFYPVNPCSGKYIIGTPLFDQVLIVLPNGKEFTINAIDRSDRKIYIRDMLLDGRKFDKGYMLHSDIMLGGHLDLNMSKEKGKPFVF